jgi:choline kinase
MTNTAVILAAGRGVRLKEMGQQIPKGFIRLGDAPIIEESIERLRQAGVARIIIVTGHLHEFYDQLARRFSTLITTVHNPRFAESGSMYSFYIAREVIPDGDFLLLESDLTYEQHALTAVLEQSSDSVLLVSGPTRSGDEVYVEAKQGRLLNMSKSRASLGADVIGELVGISRISPQLYREMLAEAELNFGESLHMEYEQALVAAGRIHPVHCHLERDLAWAEIDDAAHLQRALSQVYPRVVERDHPAAPA